LDSRDDIILINVAYSLLTIIQCRYRLFSITHLLLSPMLTKEDLAAIEGIFDKSFDNKSKSIHSKLNKLQKDMNTIVKVFDSEITPDLGHLVSQNSQYF